MQSDDAAEPIEWDLAELKSDLQEWENIASQIVAGLHAAVDGVRSRNWRPHFAQIVAVVERFRERCYAEAHRLGAWREDGLEPGEVYERVRNEGDRLVKWLNRMMQS